MAKGGKARTIIVRMISTAQTGFFYTTKRVRLNTPKLSAVKYDPIVEGTFRGESKDKEIIGRPSMHGDKYALQLNRTHLLFIPPLHLAHSSSSSPGTVIQVALRSDPAQGNVSDIFSIAQENVTWTIETLLVGHVHARPELPKCVILKEVVPGYTLIGERKLWTYGQEKRFCLGEMVLQPAQHKWVFRFQAAE